MPNWCENDLFISGPTQDIEEFVAFAEGEGPFDFNRFIPYPDDFRAPDEVATRWDEEHLMCPAPGPSLRPTDGFNNGGHAWRVANWGTKWRASHVKREGPTPSHGDGPSQVGFSFATAWAPPLPIIKMAAERFPSLRFELRYFERGAAFNGMIHCQGGEVTFDESGPYFGDRGG